MKLDIIAHALTFEEIQDLVNNHFKEKMRFMKEELSIFDSYIIRPEKRIFIPKIWSYRVLCKNNTYYFGTI
jgi:hypothetical protein